MNVERNPIVKILGQESDIDYVNDAVAFLFVVSVLRTVKGQYATKILRTLIRCYAALAFVMPLMLGSLPSGMMKDVDHYAMLVSFDVVTYILVTYLRLPCVFIFALYLPFTCYNFSI